MHKPLQRPAWPPTTHVDLIVYRTPLIIPPRDLPNVDQTGVGPDSPTPSIHRFRPAYNAQEVP